MAAYITIEDVREDMLDRTADDHLVLADLAFTDADIVWGMKQCVRKFNSLKPYVITVAHDKLPESTTVFFDGIAWALLRRWLRNLSMNDLDYEASGVTAKVQGTLVSNVGALVKSLEQDFVSAATELKIYTNLSQAFGQLG